MRGLSRATAGVIALSLVAGCSTPGEPATEAAELTTSASARGPRLRAIGTVQDGGLPHAACGCARCERARNHAAARRFVASLAILLPGSSRVFLIDATPDLREQLDRLRDAGGPAGAAVDRAPVDGVFLTHAHIGHYLGLAFFGFEAVHTHELPVWASPSLAFYLRANGPWSQLVLRSEIALREMAPGVAIDLGEGVRVTPLAVPHRQEYSDTMAFVIEGPRRRVLYVPDTDGWEGWSVPLVELLAERRIDVALLDGTFYSSDELPGRRAASIGHPPIVQSMDLLEPLVRAGRVEVWFTHCNHSNPALDPHGSAQGEITRRGFGVLDEGHEFPL